MINNHNILSFSLKEGADLAGIAKIEDLIEACPRRSPQRILPEAKSIIVFALRHSYGGLDTPVMRISISETQTIYDELKRIGYRLCRFLEERGFVGLTIPPFHPLEINAETKGLVGDLSLRHAAVSAGLGFIGRNNLLITPEFGPRVRLAAVITDAVLETSIQRVESKCGTCTACIEKCPAQALSLEKGFDLGRCVKVVGGSAGLYALTRFLLGLVEKPKAELKKSIQSPDIWGFHQALSAGISFDCQVCMTSCPLGKNIQSEAQP
ncbi:MAG: epoxyqueuosine reductase [Deltaproteobacteria bacterium]|nr:epoxyqueuosine reductase [Deltaproteobacteria bacterium]